MHPIVIDHELAQRLVSKYALVSAEHARTRARLYPATGACAREIGGGYAVFTELGCPVSGARGLGMHGPVSEHEMDDLERFFIDRGLTPDVEICSRADPSLLRLLGERDYRVTEFEHVYIHSLSGRSAAPLNPDIQVTVASPDQAALWAESVAQGFAEDGIVTESSRRIFVTQFHIPKTICYLAWINGQIAGAAMLNLLSDIATLSTTSTLPHYRGLGVQAALIETRLRDAYKAGFTLATVMVRPGSASERNFIRAGFQNAYTVLRMVKKS